jgi:hypothetical protein
MTRFYIAIILLGAVFKITMGNWGMVAAILIGYIVVYAVENRQPQSPHL